MTKHTIGTDPEFFIKNEETGKLVSAIPLISGTKHEPTITESGAGLQHDNVALEFCTPIADSGDDLVNKIKAAIKEVQRVLPAKHSIEVAPSALFDDDQLKDEESFQFGCEPDFNAWTITMNEPPKAPVYNFRSCGGHIHIGYVKESGNDFLNDFEGRILTVRTMDALHGIISVVLDNSKEAIERRKLYGAAGSHRPKDYGVEYRVLSNFWMKSPQLVMLINYLNEDCLKLIREGKADALIEEIGAEKIQEIINTGNVAEAIKVLENNIKPVLSENAIVFLNDCLQNINKYEFSSEWA